MRQQPARKGFLLPDGHGVHTDEGGAFRLVFTPCQPVSLLFQPGIVHFALLQIILADRAALGCFHGVIRNADRLAIHFQLEQDSQFLAEQVAVTIHAGSAAVPAIAQRDQQLIFPSRTNAVTS